MQNMWMQCMGNLGRDVEAQYTESGKLFAKTSVAVETGWGDNKKNTWVNVTIWGEDPATRFKEFCQKGTRVYLAGDQSINTWTSKDGETKFSVELTIKEFRVLSGGKKKEDSNNPYDGDEPA